MLAVFLYGMSRVTSGTAHDGVKIGMQLVQPHELTALRRISAYEGVKEEVYFTAGIRGHSTLLDDLLISADSR